MASSFFALLDDAVAISKPLFATLDDVAIISTKAAQKTQALIIDDIATAPSFTMGFKSEREIPIIWKIAKGSIFNKIVFLTPLILALNFFLPWIIDPLLLLGGLFLCYEAALKTKEMFSSHKSHVEAKSEDEAVKKAIKIDFILSFEILLIAFSTISEETLLMQVAGLMAVSLLVTAIVYGLVLVVVRADDIGHFLQKTKSFRWLGNCIIKIMPKFLILLSIIGVIFMASVGLHLISHSLHHMGVDYIYNIVKVSIGYLDFLGVFLADLIINVLLGFIFGIVIYLTKINFIKLLYKPTQNKS
mgnify:CR=1 FL=1